jgi:hypothetical protein
MCPVNNNVKINTFIASVFFSLGLSDSRALRSIEVHFMGIEGKMMVIGSGSHQDPLHHQIGWLCWILFERCWMSDFAFR